MTHFNDTKCFCSFQKMGLISFSKSIPEVTRKLRCSSSDGNVSGTNGLPLVRETILKGKKANKLIGLSINDVTIRER